MNSIIYKIPEKTFLGAAFDQLLATQDAVVRLDERARRSPLRDGWKSRLMFGEACAGQLTEGGLVHLEDLVLLDGHAYSGPANAKLSSALHVLKAWRRADRANAGRLLRATRPGEVGAEQVIQLPDLPVGPDAEQQSVINNNEVSLPHLIAWRRVLGETDQYPALIAAAIVWDAWLTLLPEPLGAWRAPLLAALTLKARGLTPGFLLPIDTGRRFSKYRRYAKHGFATRVAGFFSWTQTAAAHGNKEFDKLVLADEMLRLKVRARRRSSRLPALIDLFLSRPLVSVPMAARHLGISSQGVAPMMKQLGSLPREITGRSRCRAWTVT